MLQRYTYDANADQLCGCVWTSSSSQSTLKRPLDNSSAGYVGDVKLVALKYFL
jgi:hypothetical protein